MVIEINKLLQMIERRRFSTVMLTTILRHYCCDDRTTLARLMEAVGPDELERVYDVLTMYPQPDFGWTILPDKRSFYFRPDLTRAEEADLERRQFKEDREAVEHLRQLIRPTVCDK
jgi:hypothetical protein